MAALRGVPGALQRSRPRAAGCGDGCFEEKPGHVLAGHVLGHRRAIIDHRRMGSTALPVEGRGHRRSLTPPAFLDAPLLRIHRRVIERIGGQPDRGWQAPGA